MPPVVCGVSVPQRSEPEDTPRNELILQIVKDAEHERNHDRERIRALEQAVHEIKQTLEQSSASTRRTQNLTVVLVFAGAIITAIIGYRGQVNAARIGAQQGQQAAVMTVQSAQPSTEATYSQGVRDGQQRLADELMSRMQANPAPIASTARRLAQTGAVR